MVARGSRNQGCAGRWLRLLWCGVVGAGSLEMAVAERRIVAQTTQPSTARPVVDGLPSSPPDETPSNPPSESPSPPRPSPTVPPPSPPSPSAVAPEPVREAPANAVNLLGLSAAPLDEPIVTDRPDFTESALTVPYGRVQLESGYTYSYDSGDGSLNQSHTYPEMLLRLGIVEDIELRLFWLGWEHTEEAFKERNDNGRRIRIEDRDDGGADMGVGFKFHLWEQDGLRPECGIILETSLPTGSNGHTSGDVDPGMKWLWAYDLNDTFALSGNINLAVPTAENGRFFQASSSISLGCALTERLGCYVEYFGFYPNDRDTADAHYANGGLTYQITDNFQVDIRAGTGLNDEADDFFTGVGFAWRI